MTGLTRKVKRKAITTGHTENTGKRYFWAKNKTSLTRRREVHEEENKRKAKTVESGLYAKPALMQGLTAFSAELMQGFKLEKSGYEE